MIVLFDLGLYDINLQRMETACTRDLQQIDVHPKN